MATIPQHGGIFPRQSNISQLQFQDHKLSGLSPTRIFAFLRLTNQLPLWSGDTRQKMYLTCCFDEAKKKKQREC